MNKYQTKYASADFTSLQEVIKLMDKKISILNASVTSIDKIEESAENLSEKQCKNSS